MSFEHIYRLKVIISERLKLSSIYSGIFYYNYTIHIKQRRKLQENRPPP